MQTEVKRFLDRLDGRGNFEETKLKEFNSDLEKNSSQEVLDKLISEKNDQAVSFFLLKIEG